MGGKEDTIASDTDEEVPLQDVHNRQDGSGRDQKSACRVQAAGDPSQVKPAASKLLLCGQASAQTTAISSKADVHGECLKTKSPAKKPAECAKGMAGMDAQRTFLSRIQQRVQQSSWSSQTLSGRAQNGRRFGAGLAGRLQQITCTEKAQREDFYLMSDARKNGNVFGLFPRCQLYEL